MSQKFLMIRKKTKMKQLNDKDDFRWYKVRLDAQSEYSHDHYGEPSEYPCKVDSEWRDNENGPYEYHHTFIYQQKVKCPECGHETVVWPDIEKE